MYALCFACGFYVPQEDVGSHDQVCPASEDEKKAVSVCESFNSRLLLDDMNLFLHHKSQKEESLKVKTNLFRV